MSANPRRTIEFNPYKRPPAARLLAVLAVSALFAWMLQIGDDGQLEQLRRDPAKYAAHLEKISHHGVAFDILAALFSVTVIVFAVDGLTSLFGRWLTERELPSEPSGTGGGGSSSRADALLGASNPPPSEN